MEMILELANKELINILSPSLEKHFLFLKSSEYSPSPQEPA